MIPDFIPVLGYTDNAIIVAMILRSVVKRAGSDAVRRHWLGSDEGLASLWRLAGLRPSNETLPDPAGDLGPPARE